MRRLTRSLAVVALLAVGPAAADDSAIRDVIGAQIAAFAADDFVAAFAFASPAIRRIFETPKRFGRMVREGYPIHRPAAIRYLEGGGVTLQRLLITDQAGRVHLLEYEMVRSGGRHEINGVRILGGADAGA